jgi:ribosomal protein S12 methylthiotransferase accessory factor
VYQAVYDDLGVPAVRILVPDYSEVYPVEDLIWDNTNKALEFREGILCLHQLCDEDLQELLERLEQSQLDNYTDIRTLIGIEFDENTHWGQLTILELKLLICLALGQLESAQELVETFLQYNDNTVDRGLFYRALSAALEVELSEDMEQGDYQRNFGRMFGDQRMAQVYGAISGEIRFPGLEPVGMELEGLDRHQRLLQSYKKLHSWRASQA